MKWEHNGELAQRDLSELVNRLLDVESQSNSNELSRLGTKYDNHEWYEIMPIAIYKPIGKY